MSCSVWMLGPLELVLALSWWAFSLTPSKIFSSIFFFILKLPINLVQEIAFLAICTRCLPEACASEQYYWSLSWKLSVSIGAIFRPSNICRLVSQTSLPSSDKPHRCTSHSVVYLKSTAHIHMPTHICIYREGERGRGHYPQILLWWLIQDCSSSFCLLCMGSTKHLSLCSDSKHSGWLEGLNGDSKQWLMWK